MSVSSGKLEKICVKNPTSVLFARLADEVLGAGDVKRAAEICRRGLRYRPSYATGHLVMGRCHLAVGRFEEARQEFHKVLQLDSDNLSALWLIGRIELQMGWQESALQRFERILILDPLNPEVAAQAHALRGSSVLAPTVDSPDPVDPHGSADPKGSGDEMGPVSDGEGVDEEEPFAAASPEPVADVPSAADEIQAANTSPLPVEDLGLLVREIVRGGRTSDDGRESRRSTQGGSGSQVSGPTIATVTLAELYAKQGMIEQATDVLGDVVKNDPGNARAVQRLEALREGRGNARQDSS